MQAALDSDRSFAPVLVAMLGHYRHNRPLLLRVAFTLGNLTTTSTSYRQQVRTAFASGNPTTTPLWPPPALLLTACRCGGP